MKSCLMRAGMVLGALSAMLSILPVAASAQAPATPAVQGCRWAGTRLVKKWDSGNDVSRGCAARKL